MTRRAHAELLLLAICFIWGFSFVVVKGALAHADPLAFLALRFIVAGLTCVVALRVNLRRLDAATWRAGIRCGLCLLGGYILQVHGLLYTTASKSAFITAFSVVLVPVMLALGGARLRASNVAAALAGLGGLYVLLAPSSVGNVNRGDVLTLGGSFSFALYIVFVGRYAERVPFRGLVTVQVFVVGAGAALIAPFIHETRVQWTPGLLAAVVGTAVFATALAFSVQNWAQQYTPAAHTALILSLEPVFAAIVSRFIAGERMSGRMLAGAALMLTGILISELFGGRPAPIES